MYMEYVLTATNEKDSNMTNLTTLTRCNGFYRAYYSDDTSLIISKTDALGLSEVYNIRIEDEWNDPSDNNERVAPHRIF